MNNAIEQSPSLATLYDYLADADCDALVRYLRGVADRVADQQVNALLREAAHRLAVVRAVVGQRPTIGADATEGLVEFLDRTGPFEPPARYRPYPADVEAAFQAAVGNRS